jgi:hypothetical protein
MAPPHTVHPERKKPDIEYQYQAFSYSVLSF